MGGVEDLKTVLKMTRMDLWTLIETALSVAASDYRDEMKVRRDRYVELLYVNPVNDVVGAAAGFLEEDGCDNGVEDEREHVVCNGDVDVDVYDDEDEETKVIAIKELIDDPDQEEGALIDLLQNLADMDITFKALQKTDIGRHVNGLRKNPSNEVRRLVKVLVRKWKDLVDDWVKQNQNGTAPTPIINDVDSSPLQIPGKNTSLNGHNVPEFGYSPNPHNGSYGSDKNNIHNTWDTESKPKPKPPLPPPRKEQIPIRQNNLLTSSSSAPPKSREQQKSNSVADPELLASTRRRLHENYQEAHNAKKQRTIQVMDIHDIPKPKNTYFSRNRQGKHHR
ncbi:putative mediator of RNA polymerase II transcription subunit26c [Zostera marina]|uniref:Putative mediator of RNA polymerase II transcription subunit26c n=1 Tax=Zostera marina TaxID=29655 RepID=A0A0K9PNP7_ZOSMR|nr:putative mediator of RNA polymerase II transcription subunit26c [Zostera marina]